MSKTSTGILTFIIGTAVGVTAGLYLNSEDGRKLRKKTMKRLSKMEADIEERVSKAYDDLKNKISDTTEDLKSAGSHVKAAASDTKDAAINLKESAKN